jgi:hypothetical protein
MRKNLPEVNWLYCKKNLQAKEQHYNIQGLHSFKAKLLLGLAMLLMTMQTSVAQITSGFELEGNATSVLPNPPDDWDKIYNGTSSAQITTNVVSDLNNIFQGGGSKDDLDIPNWDWTTGSVPDKDDILHGGVALYNNCQLYFFADRYATNGSANIGFWLFKDSVSVNSDGTFSGVHTVGDLLLVSEFVNGGGTAVIKAYKWVGTGGTINGTLDSVAVNGTTAFAITNTTSVASPWPFTPKSGTANTFGPGAFFEGGIDLCSIPGLDACFTSFIIETRSSFAIDAVLKDFMNGAFQTKPQISLAGGTRCVDGASVTLTANVTGGLPPYSYSWNPGGDTTASITVSPTTTSTYTFSVTGVNGCLSTDTAIVIVNPAVNVNAGIDDTINCIDTQVTLNGSSTTTGATFSWAASNGGNIVSGGSTATPIVNSGGTYVLTVSANGCTATDTVVIYSDMGTPDADAGNDTTLTCIVTQVTLNGTSTTPGVTFSWVATNGGAILSGANTANPVVQVPGTYVLTVTNPTNGCTGQDSANVTQDINTPNVNAGPDGALTCTSSSIILTGSSTTLHVSFQWTTTNGNIVSGANTATPTVDAAGLYSLTVTDSINGCQAMDVAEVTTDNTAPNVSAGVDKELNCTVTQVNLSGSSSTPGAEFSWTASNGGNIVSGGILATPLVDAAGTYVLTVTNPTSGCTSSDTVIVTLNNTPPTVDLGNDTTLIDCFGSIVLDAGNAGSVYMWSTGATTQTITVSSSGLYWVQVTAANGCIATDSIQVTIIDLIDLPSDTTVCACIILDATIPNGSYMWCSGQTYPQLNVCVTGTYCVTVTNGVCVDTDTIHVTVNEPFIVNLGNDTTITGTTHMLDAGHPGMNFLWSTGETTQMITIVNSGTYSVIVSDSSCSSYDTINVVFSNSIKEATASAFPVNVYPNPTDDKTFMLNFNVESKSTVLVRIMNELGMLVYEESTNEFSGVYNKKIDLSNMSAGIYFAEIRQGNNRSIIKVSLR